MFVEVVVLVPPPDVDVLTAGSGNNVNSGLLVHPENSTTNDKQVIKNIILLINASYFVKLKAILILRFKKDPSRVALATLF